jgi:hypothetical protein
VRGFRKGFGANLARVSEGRLRVIHDRNVPLRQFVAADRLPQRGLRTEGDGFDEVCHFQDRLLGIPDQSEHTD